MDFQFSSWRTSQANPKLPLYWFIKEDLKMKWPFRVLSHSPSLFILWNWEGLNSSYLNRLHPDFAENLHSRSRKVCEEYSSARFVWSRENCSYQTSSPTKTLNHSGISDPIELRWACTWRDNLNWHVDFVVKFVFLLQANKISVRV